MFFIREMIDSGFTWLFAAVILPLCLIVPALCTTASSENPAARTDSMHMRSDSSSIDTPEVLVPKPPPPPPTY
ncbi:MAG TPA: hypothetical protein VEL74_15845 [Thermoanaerobaculia bacterium]|nr:hypothetical protein [Thermoanaerobaculia bacterium]